MGKTPRVHAKVEIKAPRKVGAFNVSHRKSWAISHSEIVPYLQLQPKRYHVGRQQPQQISTPPTLTLLSHVLLWERPVAPVSAARAVPQVGPGPSPVF